MQAIIEGFKTAAKAEDAELAAAIARTDQRIHELREQLHIQIIERATLVNTRAELTIEVCGDEIDRSRRLLPSPLPRSHDLGLAFEADHLAHAAGVPHLDRDPDGMGPGDY